MVPIRSPQQEPIRAGGDCICPACGRTYLRHPLDWDELGWDGEPYLNVLCDGTRVKL